MEFLEANTGKTISQCSRSRLVNQISHEARVGDRRPSAPESVSSARCFLNAFAATFLRYSIYFKRKFRKQEFQVKR